jgi:aspartate/methionine/tyrosine aminotransferase
MAEIAPFHVMELMTRAAQLEAEGRDIVHMEVGEPDFPTPAPVLAAAQEFLGNGRVAYTSALGLPALRQAIADFYQQRHGVDVPASRIIVTTGASAALVLALAALVNPGDEWLVTDPGYPCNRHFIRLYEGVPTGMTVGAEQHFQPTVADLAAHWTDRTAGVLLGTPANPTGTLIPQEQLAELAEGVRQRGAHLIVDEIYNGLTYDQEPQTALTLGDDIWVVQSFSKYFNMTGWRLGWLVVPERFSREVEKLAQNLFISPPTPAQHAALACFRPETLVMLEERRAEFRRRRDYLLEALAELGFGIPAKPEGAFYIYADCSRFSADSFTFARELIDQAGVAITPGIDFGHTAPEKYLRFSYTTSMERLEEGVRRLRDFLAARSQ